MAALTAAEIAARLKGDNRTAVGSADPGNAGQDLVLADLGPEGEDFGLANASTATAAAYEDDVDADTGVVVVGQGSVAGDDLSKDALRTMYFQDATGANYDSTKVGFGAKRCFVNAKNQPLDADGLPTTVADAVDAEDTDLTALGEAVTNWAQTIYTDERRTPPPGTYNVSARATSLYAPYAGWTVQHGTQPTPHSV